MPMSEKNNKKWMSSGYLKSAPSGEVDSEKGIIKGVSICTVGEAKGHGVHLDSEFIETVKKFGNEKKQGLKARFGHPNMCSTALGTFLGRYKHFQIDGNQVKADLFLSNEAKDTPNGNLYDYVLGMAQNEPDMFGTSIVFTPGREYRRDDKGEKWFRHVQGDRDHIEIVYEDKDGKERENDKGLSKELFVECKELHACDAVDDPAANDGLFSRFSNETIAGQVTEFLDLHPQVWDAVSGNPEIIKALSGHADKLDEFFSKYKNYKDKSKETEMSTKEEKTNSEKLEKSNVAAENPAAKTPEQPAAPAESAPVEKQEIPKEETQKQAKVIDAVEFEKLVKEFGAEIASKVALSGGGMADAFKLQNDVLKAENENLKNQLKAKTVPGGTPAACSSDAKGKKTIWEKN